MKEAFPGAVMLTSLLAAFSFLACYAGEGRQPDEGGNGGASIHVEGGGPFPRGHAGIGEPGARTGGHVAVERAVLSSAGDADLIHTRVEYQGSWIWPQCSLLESPDVEAVRRTISRRVPPRDEGFTRGLWRESLWDGHESSWADQSTTEQTLQDDGAVIWTFHRDPTPDGEAVDPRQTPFFVRCAGGAQPNVVHDVAHVLGTPTLAP